MTVADTAPGGAGGPASDLPMREAILAALHRLLETASLDSIRVAQILEEAKTSRATFYFYFSSLSDAFAALLEQAIGDLVPIVEKTFDGRDPDDLSKLQHDLAAYLKLVGGASAIIRNAAQEWPRMPEVRDTYIRGMERQAAVLKRTIDEDRAAGLAPDGVPSAQLATGLMWTIERVWYEAVTDGSQLGDGPAAIDAVAHLVVNAIYGHD